MRLAPPPSSTDDSPSISPSFFEKISGLVHRTGGALLSDFVKQINRWQAEGYIDEKTADQLLDDLRDPEVQHYLSLLAELKALGLLVGIPFTLAGLAGIAVAPWMGPFLGYSVRGLILNLFVQLSNRPLPAVQRQVVAFSAMIPNGDNAPLVFLYRRFPELTRAVRLYLRNRQLAAAVSYLTEGRRLRLDQRAYLTLLLRGKKASPEALIAIERRRLQGVFADPNGPEAAVKFPDESA